MSGRPDRILALGLLLALAGTPVEGQEREKLPTLKQTFAVTGEKTVGVRFSADGKLLALGGSASIRILSVGGFKELRRLSQQGLVDDLLFEPSGKYLLTRSRDEDTIIWETAGWSRLKFALETGLPGIDPATVPPPDPKEWTALADRMKGFKLWKLDPLQEKRRWAGRVHVGDCGGILLDRVAVLTSFDVSLLIGDDEGHLLIVPWDRLSLTGPDLRRPRRGEPAVKLRTAVSARLFRPHEGEISSLGVSADRRFCVSSGRDGKVHLWSFEKLPVAGAAPRPLPVPEPLWTLPGYVAELSPNGLMVAVADRNGVTVYETATGKPVSFNPTRQTGGRVVRLRFSPDGSMIAAVICRCGDCGAGEAFVSYRKTLLEHGGDLVVWN